MDQVRRYIVLGALESGDQLPSIRELSGQIGVNPQTIVKAYNELEHGGIIEMRRGRGAFLAEGAGALAGIDYEKQLRQSLKTLLVESANAGYSLEQVRGIFEEMMNEAGSEPVRERKSKPDLKIIGGGSP